MTKLTVERIPSFPPQVTSFVGRETELSEIARLLADPYCRLLTLAGPGGIGKSRLALQAASRIKDLFGDGIYFVALAAAHDRPQMLNAIADAFGLSLSGATPVEDQILGLLSDRQALLLLDNLEQLLPDVGFLSEWLHKCPGIKLFTTSREVLNLQEEWIYPLHGLSLPAHESDLDDSDAVHLFVERARRVHPHFALLEECRSVGRICRLVEGMPLAIELAASWLRNMSCDAIADEIERNAGFLSSRLRNLPERHRSLQAVFEHTWRLLNAAEQQTYCSLSVFENGFRWEAARQVAGASLPMLTTLVDKSLLRVDAQGRYHLHNLLRQFGRERLTEEDGAESEACRRHAAYYLGLLAGRGDDIAGRDQQQALDAIAGELDNIRAAWRFAVNADMLDALCAAGAALQTYFDFQSRFQEEADVFEWTVKRLEQRPTDPAHQHALATLLPLLGWCYLRLGKLEQASRCFRRSIDLYTALDAPLPTSWGLDPWPGLALVVSILGDYTQAIEIAREAERLCLARNDHHNLQIVYYVWQSAAQAQGDYVTAQHYAEKAYSLTESVGNRWMMAYLLSELGSIARAKSDTAQARRYYTAGYEIKQAFADAEGMAAAQIQLAHIALLEGQPDEATIRFCESEALYRQVHDQGGLVNALHGLGQTALAVDDLGAAAGYLAEALRIADGMQWTPSLLAILTTIADLLHKAHAHTRSVEILDLVVNHPAGDHRTRYAAASLRNEYRSHTIKTDEKKADSPILAADLHALATSVQLELATLQLTKASHDDGTPTQPLVEPLTQRELEVLTLMAEGLTNQEIADTLIVAIGTVKSYTSQIYGKLGVRNRTEAVGRAQDLELIPQRI